MKSIYIISFTNFIFFMKYFLKYILLKYWHIRLLEFRIKNQNNNCMGILLLF